MNTKTEIMFTEKEIKNMKSITNKRTKIFIFILFILLAIVSLFNSILKFIIAKTYAQLIHKDISEIFNGLYRGFSPEETYTGNYCLAVQYLGNSIDTFLATIAILVLLIIILRVFKLNSIIINLLDREKKENIIC